jgi:hypothetical protein
MALRNDSMMWSVATPRWVTPSSSSRSIDHSTPRVAATSAPSAVRCGGTP